MEEKEDFIKELEKQDKEILAGKIEKAKEFFNYYIDLLNSFGVPINVNILTMNVDLIDIDISYGEDNYNLTLKRLK